MAEEHSRGSQKPLGESWAQGLGWELGHTADMQGIREAFSDVLKALKTFQELGK